MINISNVHGENVQIMRSVSLFDGLGIYYIPVCIFASSELGKWVANIETHGGGKH